MSIQERTPAAHYGSVEQPHLEQPARKCCKIKCRVRYFYSKGAFLVILWTTLISAAMWGSNAYTLLDLLIGIPPGPVYFKYYELLTYVSLFVCVPLAGWLADAKFGNYQVFKGGSVLMFVGTTINSINFSITSYAAYWPFSSYGTAILMTSTFIGLTGATACLVTALQLGLDQMPDASADNITSFIAWFVFSLFVGFWVPSLKDLCRTDNENDLVRCLIASVCMAVICCSLFTLAPKYLVIEPKSPQTLKTIYRVLRFAAKHKAPLNRSAFTYWEEDIPSRLDLGKSKYGGPFTTEQVEDVKTLLKILTLLVPIFITGLASPLQDIYLFQEDCSMEIFISFPQNLFFGILVSTIIYEFVIFPIFRHKLPSTLKCIGCALCLSFVLKCLYLATSVVDLELSTAQLANSTEVDYTVLAQVKDQVIIGSIFVNGSVIMLLIKGVWTFVCAQSPYNMRGLLTGYTMFVMFSSLSLSGLAYYMLADYNPLNKKFAFYRKLISAVLSLIGLILYCLLAHWYKRRVRDEDYSTQRVVEEVYDRYLSQVPRAR